VNSNLQKLFDLLELQRASILNEIKPLSTETLNKHVPGKWSLNQVLAHIISSEQLSVKYLKKKIQGIDETTNTGLIEELKMLVLVVSQRLPLKFKAPKMVVENTPQYLTAAQLEQAWNQTRGELTEVLNQFKDQHLKRKIYKHPFAGKLNIQQMLHFFSEHIIHHQPQIKKLLKQN
jgi:uncharacterized damage-inducible protein DinB